MKNDRVINCLLQVHIADEETKFGLSAAELDELVTGFQKANELNELRHIKIAGLMGMGSLSADEKKLRAEYKLLGALYDKYAGIHTANFHFRHLSMGMSGDYQLAVDEGSNMVRIGSRLFGARTKI